MRTCTEPTTRNKLLADQSLTMGVIFTHYTLVEEKIFNIFVQPGEVVEIRILNAWGKSPAWEGFAKGTISGYFDNFKAFKEAVRKAIQAQQNNIYFTLQVIDPRLIGRAYNKLKPSNITTSDSNVVAYRWIPIDIDPVRPSGISSSNSELRNAIEIRDIIREYIIDTTDYSDPITAVSGNGAHILIRLPRDLPVNDDSKELVRSFLEKVSIEFSTEDIAIDTTVCNPARIWKLYGTKAMKGDEIPSNRYREALVHRQSYIDNLGDVYGI